MFLDFSRFRYDEKHTYLEIYYLLYDLHGHKNLSVNKEIWLEFILTDVNRDSALAKETLKVVLENNNSAPQDATIKGSLIKTVLPKGNYKIKMVRLDALRSLRLDSLSYNFSTPTFENEKIALSDVELCSNIKTASTNKSGLFYKNTMEVFPNPMRMYGKETPKLYYYAEIYNLNSDNAREKVQVEVVIADPEGQIRARKSYKKNRRHESSVEVGSFDVSGLENGLYTLILAVTDSVNNYSVYNRNNFYVMNTDELSEDNLLTEFSQSEFFNMSEEEVDRRFEEAHYVATRKEIQIFNSLTNIDSKRMYLFRFWRERELEGKGLKKEYYDRVAYANDQFPFINTDGWKTDRGRVYIKYGEPDVIERRPSTSGDRPYVIWVYHDIEGGCKFLFVDESGFGDYKLKSSTLRGEIYDPSYDFILSSSP